jgi:hypothetical protein
VESSEDVFVSQSAWRNALAVLGVLFLYVWLSLPVTLLVLPAVRLHDPTGQNPPAETGPWPPVVWVLVAVVLVYPFVPLWRAATRRTLVSAGAISHRRTFSTWCVPLACMEKITRVGRRCELHLDDGRTIQVVAPLVHDIERVCGRLDTTATTDCPRQTTLRPTVYPPRRGAWSSIALVALGTIMWASAISVLPALHLVQVAGADHARSELVEATVVRVDRLGGYYRIAVQLPVDHRVVRARVWRDDRLSVEDTVRVSYDPENLDNVELAERPHVDAAPARAVLAVSATGFIASALGSIALVVHRGRARHRAQLCASIHSCGGPSTDASAPRCSTYAAFTSGQCSSGFHGSSVPSSE